MVAGEFVIEEPRTVDAALDLLADGEESVRVIAGGSGLVLLMRYGYFEPTCLVSLRRLPAEMSRVTVDSDATVRVGALATLRDLEDSAVVGANIPVLTQTLSRLASIRVRNVATMGGALVHGHPQMDLPPVMMALGAKVKVESRRAGPRWLAVEDLLLGYYETALSPDELLTEVVIPAADGAHAVYRKVTARAADDWPMLGIAACCRSEDGRWRDVRVTVGAVAERPERLPATEALLEGAAPTDELFREAATAGAAVFDYHDGPEGSATYQRHLVETQLRRTLEELGHHTRGGRG